MKRRWQVFMWKVIFLMLCLEGLSLTAFCLDAVSNLGNRLSLLMTLVLTAVAFLYVARKSLPQIPYLTFLDKYILSGYVFLVGTMVETSLVAHSQHHHKYDLEMLYFCLIYLVTYHIAFIIYAIRIRGIEIRKLIMDSDQIEKEVTQNRPALEFDYREGQRQGQCTFDSEGKQREDSKYWGRLLVFTAGKKQGNVD